VAQLEAEERNASMTRNSLQATANQLREEILALRTELLKHAGCNCPLIQNYLTAAAQQAYGSLGTSSSVASSIAVHNYHHHPQQAPPTQHQQPGVDGSSDNVAVNRSGSDP